MFRFIIKSCVCTIRNFGKSLAFNSKRPIKCLKSLNNHPCQARPTVANINSDETLFYPFTIIVNKCDGGCNATDDPYAPFCVPNKVKYIHAKVFHLISGVMETRLLV